VENELVKGHVKACPRCYVEMLEWSRLFEPLRFPVLQSPPEYATRNCLAIFPRQEKPSIGRQIMATIVFDSAFATQASGIRGSAEARQIRLCGGNADFHLRISDNGKRIFGQVFQSSNGDFIAGASIKVLRAGGVINATVTDGMGEFGFHLPQSGELSFQADLPDGKRVVSNIVIEGRTS
jgi:hypothetical protein